MKTKSLLSLWAVIGALILPTVLQAQSDTGYRLSSRDLITVIVYQHTDLGITQRVDAAGRIHVPLLGDVAVADKTLREAESHIAELFRSERILAKPQVAISVDEYSIKRVSILGEVKNPGIVEFSIEAHQMDVREAIARVGGFTSVARRSDIQVYRKGDRSDDSLVTLDFNDLLSNKGERTFYVYDNDVIFVPERIF